MSVTHNSTTVDRVVVQFDMDLDALPPDVHSIRADVRIDPDRMAHNDFGYVMRVECSWMNHCNTCGAAEPNDIDWLVAFDTMTECFAYVGAIADHFGEVATVELTFDQEQP